MPYIRLEPCDQEQREVEGISRTAGQIDERQRKCLIDQQDVKVEPQGGRRTPPERRLDGEAVGEEADDGDDERARVPVFGRSEREPHHERHHRQSPEQWEREDPSAADAIGDPVDRQAEVGPHRHLPPS
jgi:hypothetical protein